MPTSSQSERQHPAPRRARLQARLSEDTLAELEFAASLQGMTLTDFVVSSAQAAARQIIEQRHVMKFSPAAWQAIQDALENPPSPNDALRRAFAEHKRMTTGEA